MGHAPLKEAALPLERPTSSWDMVAVTPKQVDKLENIMQYVLNMAVGFLQKKDLCSLHLYRAAPREKIKV